MIVRLRTLTMKSILGFGGWDKDKSILEYFNTYREFDLLKLYYFFGNIDFNEEIKKKLFITKEREIEKPGNLRMPAIHPFLKINAYEIITLCLIDFNSANNTEAYKKMRGGYKKNIGRNNRIFVNRQWSNKGYNKDSMRWINQHYGINR